MRYLFLVAVMFSPMIYSLIIEVDPSKVFGLIL